MKKLAISLASVTAAVTGTMALTACGSTDVATDSPERPEAVASADVRGSSTVIPPSGDAGWIVRTTLSDASGREVGRVDWENGRISYAFVDGASGVIPTNAPPPFGEQLSAAAHDPTAEQLAAASATAVELYRAQASPGASLGAGGRVGQVSPKMNLPDHWYCHIEYRCYDSNNGWCWCGFCDVIDCRC